MESMDAKELARTGAKRAKLTADLAAANERLTTLAEQALRDGMRPGEVVRLSTLSPAQVRMIARRAGVGPATPGPARSKRART